MAKCIKCDCELIHDENTNFGICPKCGAKYKVTSGENLDNTLDITLEQKRISNSTEPQSLFEQFKNGTKNHDNTISATKAKRLFIAKLIIWLIAVALIITCIAIWATPISYNSQYTYKYDSNYYGHTTVGYIFNKNNICKSTYNNKISSIDLYYINENDIYINNSRTLKIINHTTIMNTYGDIYKADNGGEIFLAVITSFWGVFAIIFTIVNNKKKTNLKDDSKEIK